MQLGPNGELIPASLPSSITAAAGRVQPTAYHAVTHPVAAASLPAVAHPAAASASVASLSQANGSSTNGWKMTDLAPLYTTSQLGHGFTVMEPLASGHATMLPMTVTGRR